MTLILLIIFSATTCAIVVGNQEKRHERELHRLSDASTDRMASLYRDLLTSEQRVADTELALELTLDHVVQREVRERAARCRAIRLAHTQSLDIRVRA